MPRSIKTLKVKRSPSHLSAPGTARPAVRPPSSESRSPATNIRFLITGYWSPDSVRPLSVRLAEANSLYLAYCCCLLPPTVVLTPLSLLTEWSDIIISMLASANAIDATRTSIAFIESQAKHPMSTAQ